MITIYAEYTNQVLLDCLNIHDTNGANMHV